MKADELQEWLGAHGHPVVVDGKPGRLTCNAIIAAFSNTCAPAVSDQDIEMLARRLGCGTKQLRAVAKVECGGAGFDDKGRPKILFERHLFHRMTKGKWTPASFSQPKGGGYNQSSWEKLTLAACKNVDAAFSSASWGKFQVLGMHWSTLGYNSPLEMAYSTVTGEAAHYDMLARFIEKNGLRPKLQALSANPEDNRAFAKAYNGPKYEDFSYHKKLANAMK